MSFINFGEGYVSPEEEIPDTDLACYMAFRILGANKLPVPEETAEDTSYLALKVDLRHPSEHGDEGEDDCDEDSEERVADDLDEEGEFDDPIFYETFRMLVNDTQQMYLSNRPFVFDEQGRTDIMTDPGYVALHLELKDMPSSYFPPPAALSGQIIFRMPVPSEDLEAAIFYGYALNDSNRIEDEEEIDKIIDVLHDFETNVMSLWNNPEGPHQYTELARTPFDPFDDVSIIARDNGSN